jgi:hypothetical protein
MPTGVPAVDEAIATIVASAGAVGSQVDGLAAPQLKVLVADFHRARSAMDATWFRLLSAVEDGNVHVTTGARDTTAFVSDATGESPAAIKRDLETATKLPTMPEVSPKADQGELGAAKLHELARLLPEVPAQVREDIVRRATRLNVRQVREEVARANLQYRPTPPPVQKPEAMVTREIERTKLSASLPHLEGSMVESALHAAATDLALPAEMGTMERLGQGLVALARYYLGNRPTADTTLRNRINLFVTVDVETLAAGQGSAVVGGGGVIDADTARRIACDCHVSRVLTDAASEILDVGRLTRSIPRGLLSFLVLEDGGCRWPGCDAPVWSCEGHHVRFWEDLGPTDRDNVALLCWHHHHLLHADHRWHLSIGPRRSIQVAFEDRLIGETRPRKRGRSPAPPRPLEPAEPPGVLQPELLPLAGA